MDTELAEIRAIVERIDERTRNMADHHEREVRQLHHRVNRAEDAARTETAAAERRMCAKVKARSGRTGAGAGAVAGGFLAGLVAVLRDLW